MYLTDLPLSFWGYALETAAFTLNRAPSKSVEMTPCELWFSKKTKLSFRGYALETAPFTLNRAPSKSVETTPYELWFGKKPKLSFLKVWGCDAYVKKLHTDKFEPKSEECVFIGYPKETVGYTFYHRSEGKIFCC